MLQHAFEIPRRLRSNIRSAEAILRQGRPPEDRLLIWLIVGSALIHLAVALYQHTRDANLPPLVLEEAVTVDLLGEFDLGAPEKTTIPDVEKVAPEATVPETMLPQLPKNVTIKEQAPAPAEVEGEEVSAPPVTESDEPVATEEPPTEDTPVESSSDSPPAASQQKTETDIAELVDKADVKVPQDEEPKDNPLEEADFRKRAALERLRDMKQISREKKTEAVDPLAAIRAELKTRQGKGQKSFASAGSKRILNQYRDLLYKTVRRHYALPETYKAKSADTQVAISIILTASGSLRDVEIIRSSGDAVFDELTMKAVKLAAPLPKPPTKMIGRPLTLVFTP